MQENIKQEQYELVS